MKRRESIKRLGAMSCLAIFPIIKVSAETDFTEAVLEQALVDFELYDDYTQPEELISLGRKAIEILKESGAKDEMFEYYIKTKGEGGVLFNPFKPKYHDVYGLKKVQYAFGFTCPQKGYKDHDKLFRKGIIGLERHFAITSNNIPESDIEMNRLVIRKYAKGIHPTFREPIEKYYEIGLFGRGYGREPRKKLPST